MPKISNEIRVIVTKDLCSICINIGTHAYHYASSDILTSHDILSGLRWAVESYYINYVCKN